VGGKHIPDSTAILADLIAINSENPGGSEVAIADYCTSLMSAHGIDHEIVAKSPDRPNVLARLEGGGAGKIIYQCHIDTKPAYHAGAKDQHWLRDPFTPVIENGMMYGLGACDTKGGGAAQLRALLQLAQDWRPEYPTLEWQGVADEEDGSAFGAEYLAGEGRLAADFAIVAEPTNGVVSTRQLGSVWVDVQITGEQSHGGMPWLGKDAIGAGLSLIEKMKRRVAERPRDGAGSHHPAVGVRMLEGGGHAGTVAGQFRIVSDIRVRPDERREDYIDLWRQAADEIEAEAHVSIHIGFASGGGCEPHALTDPRLLDMVAHAWTDTIGAPFEPQLFYGGSDARYFAANGVPAIVFGAGDLAHAHAPNEFVPIDEVLRCEAFLTALPGHFTRRRT
jgi:acetylornithine deacetylase/succinyl-diaminopimelate desuccinylase-like protein